MAGNVVHLDPAPAVFAAMSEGWRRQQAARFLKTGTVVRRTWLMQRVVTFSGLYPWQWTPAEGEAFIPTFAVGMNLWHYLRLAVTRSRSACSWELLLQD
ncbi:hypothetical protein ACFT1A_26720 [Rhodococcus sp. NPDC057135]|uniref:hypothetical protein n=1 Tax=Rhodococcus sp. NPDC057135 TaxID=3346028 RepID=UPI003645E16A